MKTLTKVLSLLTLAMAFGTTAVLADSTATLTTEPAAQDVSAQVADTAAQAIPSPSKSAVWIKLEGDVEPSMYDYAARAIGEAVAQKPDYIVFEINTFGGRLDAAFDIVDTIMAVDKNIKTIALVKKKAISAGSLIALANDELYMMEATTIGDCAPIVQNSDGTPQIVGEKIQSPLRAKFRNLAQQNGYPELLSSAFVTPELEVYQLTKSLAANGKEPARDTTMYIEKKKYEVMTQADKDFWGSPKILVKEGELLTMTEKEAIELGFSKGTFKGREDFETALSIETKDEVETTMGENIAGFLAGISGILLIIGLGCLFVEFKTPGFGVFGIIGIIMVAIVFLGQYASSLDGYFPALLLAAGVILFLVEIFVMPGTFLFGVGGIICMIIALTMTIQATDIPEFIPGTLEALDISPWLLGLLYILSCSAVALLIPILASKYLIPKLPEGWTPMLKTDLETATSPTEAINAVKVGDVGEAKTFLRPVGQALINDQLFDVHTHGEIIEPGSSVKVISIQEGHIFVTAVKN